MESLRIYYYVDLFVLRNTGLDIRDKMNEEHTITKGWTVMLKLGSTDGFSWAKLKRLLGFIKFPYIRSCVK